MEPLETKGLKRKRCEEEAVKNHDRYGHDESGVDRLSDLPEAIVHHILLRLPVKDAVETRALSKRWPRVWATCPILCFNESFFGADSFAQYDYDLAIREAFTAFLAESLQKLKNSMVKYTLDHFGLFAATFSGDSEKVVNDWVDFALENNVKQLDLGIRRTGSHGFRSFRLGDNVFTSQKLTQLFLEFCMVAPSCSIDLPSLKKLSLSEVEIRNYSFSNLILGCPLLEDLHIKFCSGLSQIDVLTPHLRSLKLNLSDLSTVRIESSRLQSVEFNGEYCTTDVQFANVKDMTLKDLTVSDDGLRGLLSGLPLLENLVLMGCKNLQSIDVSCKTLRSLVISRCRNVSVVDIDVPKLISLNYSGHKMISFTSKSSLELVNGKISLDPLGMSSDWYVGLKELLQSLANCKRLTMVFRDPQVVSFPVGLYSELTPLVRELKHLNLETCSSSTTFNDIVKGLVWVLPDLETLTIKKGPIRTTIKCSEAADAEAIQTE